MVSIQPIKLTIIIKSEGKYHIAGEFSILFSSNNERIVGKIANIYEQN